MIQVSEKMSPKVLFLYEVPIYQVDKHKKSKFIFSIFISKAETTAFIQHNLYKLSRYILYTITKPRQIFT